MRKLLPGGFALLAVLVTLLAPGMAEEKKAPVADYRLTKLQLFFDRFDCPAKEYSGDFLVAADRNALDWRVLPSISYLESGGGKTAMHNNLFGWNSGRASFETVRAGIHEVGYRLTHSQMYRSKSLDQVLATYNPVGEYARKVRLVMAQIAPTP